MNIFLLDTNLQKSVQAHCDKHIVKMPLETTQMLCSVLYLWGAEASLVPYKLTHPKHPCTLWAASSYKNFTRLVKTGKALCKEYEYRYNKTHACLSVIHYVECLAKKVASRKLKQLPETPQPVVVPEDCKKQNTIDSYREYYIKHKSHIFNWKKRSKPSWIK